MIDIIFRPLIQAMNETPTFSPTGVALWMECRQKWNYVYHEHLKKASSGTLKMNRGTFFHRYCHYFYNLKQQNLRNDTIIAAMQSKMRDDVKTMTLDTVPVFHSVIPLVQKYITQRSPDIDSGMKVLATEYQYWVPLTTPKGRYVALHGYIDLVYMTNFRRIRIRDHKSGERLDTWSKDKILFNPQMRDYDLALSLSNPWNLPVEGVEISWVNTKEYPPNSKAKGQDVPWELYTGFYSQVQRDEYLTSLLHKIDLMLDGDVYRTYNKDCDKCIYFPICYREEKGLPTAATISTQYERINHKKRTVIENRSEPQEKREEDDSNGLSSREPPHSKMRLALPRREHQESRS
jgi:hypothetical protein